MAVYGDARLVPAVLVRLCTAWRATARWGRAWLDRASHGSAVAVLQGVPWHQMAW